MILVMGLALASFGLGTGLGWGIPNLIPASLVFFLGCGAYGAMFGGALGFAVGLIRRGRPGSIQARFWGAADRPISLLGWARRRAQKRPRAARSPAQRLRARALWVGIPLGLVALILLVAAGAGAYTAWSVDRRLAVAVSRADVDDPYWRHDDLMANREEVPDAENSALVVAEVVSLLPENWPGNPPAPPGHPLGALPAVAKASDELSTIAGNIRLDDPIVRTLRDELEAYAEAVAIARTVVGYDRGRHELETGPTVIDTPLGETQAARSVARLLAADAAIRAHDGDLGGGLDSSRAVLGVARSIGDEPTMISQLVRIAIGVVAMQSTRRVLGQGESPEDALARLQALLLDEMGQPLAVHAMRGERAMLTEVIRRVSDGEMSISALSGGPIKDSETPGVTTAPLVRLMFENQMAVGLEWMNDAVAIAHAPAPARKALGDSLGSQQRSGPTYMALRLDRDAPDPDDAGPDERHFGRHALPGRVGSDGPPAGGRAPSNPDRRLACVPRLDLPGDPPGPSARPVFGPPLPTPPGRRAVPGPLHRPGRQGRSGGLRAEEVDEGRGRRRRGRGLGPLHASPHTPPGESVPRIDPPALIPGDSMRSDRPIPRGEVTCS